MAGSNPEFDREAAQDALRVLKGNLAGITDDSLEGLVARLFLGYEVVAPFLDAGTRLFGSSKGQKLKRARLKHSRDCISSRAGLGELVDEPVEFLFTSREAAIFNVSPGVGETVNVVHWETSEAILVNHAGYTDRTFERLGSSRPVASWTAEPLNTPPAQMEVLDFLADLFTLEEVVTSEHKRLLTVIGKRMFSDQLFGGLLLPTVAMRGNADLLVLKSERARRSLRFARAEFAKIDELKEFSYECRVLDSAPEISGTDKLEWYASGIGEPKLESQRYGTVGWKEFLAQKQHLLREYDSSREININRPVRVQHGQTAESAFRRWLGQYLPKRYGVTSGFVIPDIRSMNYKIRHHDVIVYDVLNSPVLWASGDSEVNEQGRERAIPARFVYAVLEVKATFTKKHIDDAVLKLEELAQSQAQLPKNFVSMIVFFEVRVGQQQTCKLAEPLARSDLPGYCGGLILRAEAVDPNLAGYFSLHEDEVETLVGVPLVRDPGRLQRDGEGNPQITAGCGCITAYAFDDVWNFDNGYSPTIKNLNLVWSYNSFASFCLDFLERLQGTYDASAPKTNSYGLSFSR